MAAAYGYVKYTLSGGGSRMDALNTGTQTDTKKIPVRLSFYTAESAEVTVYIHDQDGILETTINVTKAE